MSFITENTALFRAVKWGITDPVDKSTCQVGNPWDNKWFHKFHNAVSNRGQSCMCCFQFISERSIDV